MSISCRPTPWSAPLLETQRDHALVVLIKFCYFKASSISEWAMADPSAKEAAGTDHLSNSVQEMSINGNEPPQEYTVKDGNFGYIESSPPLGSIPIINISLFLPSSSHDPKQVEKELQKLRSALSSSAGCFQVNFLSFLRTYPSLNL